MTRIFAALLVSYLLLVSAAASAGFLADGNRWFAVHFALGLFTTLYTCGVYCIVLTYFVITGKMVKQAVLTSGLDPELINSAQQPKGRVVRLTALGVAAALCTALLGAWANVAEAVPDRHTWHLVAAMLAVMVNGAAFTLIYQAICDHGRLVDTVFAKLNDKRPTAAQPANALVKPAGNR